MTNDAKLGMLAGVLGVIVAAVLFAHAPPPSAQSRPGVEPQGKENAATQPASPANAAPGALSGTNTAALPSTPVARTRKDVDAQPTSRQGGMDEEP